MSFISNISGAPQVWIVPSEGGYPRMVTNGDDPVTEQQWSPASDWIALGIAPGGGLNAQIYVVKPDGTSTKLLTLGGSDNNGLNAWTEDGKRIAIDSAATILRRATALWWMWHQARRSWWQKTRALAVLREFPMTPSARC